MQYRIFALFRSFKFSNPVCYSKFEIGKDYVSTLRSNDFQFVGKWGKFQVVKTILD